MTNSRPDPLRFRNTGFDVEKMKVAKYLLTPIFLMAISLNAFAFDESLQTVVTRGVEQKFLLTKPNQEPTASIILFTGSGGKLALSSSQGFEGVRG